VKNVDIAVYTRTKNGAGQWRYHGVKTGRGVKTGTLAPPFYFRRVTGHLTSQGKPQRTWIQLKAETLQAGREELKTLQLAFAAQAKGLTVAEADDLNNANRTPLRIAVEKFLDLKRGKAPKTVAQYTLVLQQFREQVQRKIRFVDEVNELVLDSYKRRLEEQGLAPKTIKNRLLIVCFLLKKNGIQNSTKLVEMPTIEEEVPEPYTREQIESLFAYMDREGLEEEKLRYKFFLGSSLREKEVMFAEWDDIDFSKGTIRVHAKKDVGFTVKNHEDRRVPLPTDLLESLKERHKKPPHERWIFVSEAGTPEGHFLRRLKTIALRAGLNCRRCRTKLTKGSYDHKHVAEVTCAKAPVCERWKLHRFRKTRATRWMEAGIPVRNIQKWLGHRSLETTMVYLGLTGVEELRSKIDAA
jgi:integrase